MALIYADRVQETITVSAGTGSVTFAGAVTNFQTFASGIGAGNQVAYTITGAAGHEVGIGTVSALGMTRDVVLYSSQGSAGGFSKTNFAGSLIIFNTLPATFANGSLVVTTSAAAVAGGKLLTGTTNQIVATVSSNGVVLTLASSAVTDAISVSGAYVSGKLVVPVVATAALVTAAGSFMYDSAAKMFVQSDGIGMYRTPKTLSINNPAGISASPADNVIGTFTIPVSAWATKRIIHFRNTAQLVNPSGANRLWIVKIKLGNNIFYEDITATVHPTGTSLGFDMDFNINSFNSAQPLMGGRIHFGPTGAPTVGVVGDLGNTTSIANAVFTAPLSAQLDVTAQPLSIHLIPVTGAATVSAAGTGGIDTLIQYNVSYFTMY